MEHIVAMIPGKPTEEELLLAKQELETMAANGKFHLSKDAGVRSLQVKLYAKKYAYLRESKKKAPEVYDEAEELRKNIQRDHLVARTIMGPESQYAQVSYADPKLKQTKIIRFLFEEFHYSKRSNVLLIGDTGSGKTYGAVCYAVSQANFKFAVDGEPICDTQFIRGYTIAETLQRKQWDTLDKIRAKKRLIVDDLGTNDAGFINKDFIQFFEDLFIERHEKQKQTILTANGTLDQIRQVYGERFISRLRDSGEIYQTDDPDFRKQGSESNEQPATAQHGN